MLFEALNPARLRLHLTFPHFEGAGTRGLLNLAGTAVELLRNCLCSRAVLSFVFLDRNDDFGCWLSWAVDLCFPPRRKHTTSSYEKEDNLNTSTWPGPL